MLSQTIALTRCPVYLQSLQCPSLCVFKAHEVNAAQYLNTQMVVIESEGVWKQSL